MGLEEAFIEFLKDKEPELAERDRFLQGKSSAAEAVQKNRIDERTSAQAVLDITFGFSEFQELGLYHEGRVFSSKILTSKVILCLYYLG
jgi:hypothetical protein